MANDLQLVYEDELTKLYLGDAIESLDSVPFYDLLLTDPPYGISYRSRHNGTWRQGNNGMIRRDSFGRPENFPGIMGDDEPFDPSPFLGRSLCAIFGGNYFSSKLPDSSCWIIWDKLCGLTPAQQADCEMVWTNFGRPSRIFSHLWRGALRAGEENISCSRKLHPHQKPIKLLKFIIKYSRISHGGLIFDPFAGSASTLIAARSMGFRSVGVEKDPHWIPSAIDRLNNKKIR